MKHNFLFLTAKTRIFTAKNWFDEVMMFSRTTTLTIMQWSRAQAPAAKLCFWRPYFVSATTALENNQGYN